MVGGKHFVDTALVDLAHYQPIGGHAARRRDRLCQVGCIAGLRDAHCHDLPRLRHIVPDKGHPLSHRIHRWKGYLEDAARVELDGKFLAFGADYLGADLAVDVIYDHRVLPCPVLVPGQRGDLLVVRAVANGGVGVVGLLPDAVEIFVEALEETGQQFLGVLLLVAGESRGEVADGRLEAARRHNVWPLGPHFLDQIAILFSDPPVGLVSVRIDLSHVLAVDEEVSQAGRRIHALQRRVHETRVP
mmetsp:Transcript_10094/g.18380  ORF Transcript_10094/g.18380 Transcript_10094/m.18380 type:complete len:245 (-) Transcript_10094:1329-2063(-)